MAKFFRIFIISTSLTALVMGAVAVPAEAYRDTSRPDVNPPAKESVEDRGSGRNKEDNCPKGSRDCFPEDTLPKS